MAVKDPVKVPKKNIGSVDVLGFSGGWNLNEDAKGNQLVEGSNVEMDIAGLLGPSKSLQRWLPDTVGTVYEVYPALWLTPPATVADVVNFVADDGKIKWCIEGDQEWEDCGGDNTITMPPGKKIRFLRVLDVLLILGGDGGNKLAYVDLATKNVIKYTAIADPSGAMTIVPTGITNSGAYKIYYGYTFSGPVGETKISPILDYTISKPRSQWKTDGSEYLTISRPAGAPAAARYWNLYIALAANGGTIQETDMLLLAGGLDLNTLSIVDNGTLAIDIGRGNPPAQNSTDGMKVKFGIESNGRPILFGDVDNPYNIWIGGDGEYALDFSSSNGGYRAEVSKGTNYYPASVIGFRNGQGIPSLTILFSNTQGISKQATLEQQTINYGNQSFVVWGVTEQHYGAAGVASSNGVVNYKGQLSFPSTDGFMSMDTQPSLQNVLATKGIDKDIKPYTQRIKVSALPEIVGTAWNDRVLWIVPAYGFDTPTHILIRDLNNEGAWNPPLEIESQWIGTVSPPNTPAFVYICQGNKILKLFESFGTVHYKGGTAETFATHAKGAMMGINDARNAFQAVVQAVFYVLNLVGDMTIGVTYRNQNGKLVTKSKPIEGPRYVLSSSGGWSDPQYVYNGAGAAMPADRGWSSISQIDDAAATRESLTKRHALSINDLASEVQWWYRTPAGYNNYKLKSVSYEGENLGVKPDLR